MKFLPSQTPAGHATSRYTVSDHPPLRYYKINDAAVAPVWGTDHSACFDLSACLSPGEMIKGFDTTNEKFFRTVGRKLDDERGYISLFPGDRIMVPTGLIFDIPVGYSVRLHSRSGLAVKEGLVLANHEGVIDSDYVDPTFVVLHNTTAVELRVFHGDRIAQAEMQVDIAYELGETTTKPAQKTDRAGGFGSTGKD